MALASGHLPDALLQNPSLDDFKVRSCSGIKNLGRGDCAVFVPELAKPGFAQGLNIGELPFVIPAACERILLGGILNGEVMEELRESGQIQVKPPVFHVAFSRIPYLYREVCHGLEVINQKGEIYRADAFRRNLFQETILNNRIIAAGVPEGL